MDLSSATQVCQLWADIVAKQILGNPAEEKRRTKKCINHDEFFSSQVKVISISDSCFLYDLEMELLQSAKDGKIDPLKKIAAIKEINIDPRDTQEYTPLHHVSMNGIAEAISVLLEAGADIEAKDHLQRTPLLLAITAVHKEAAICLIDQGKHCDQI